MHSRLVLAISVCAASVCGCMTAAPGTPKAFDDYIRADTRKWAEVIKTSGIKLD